MNDAKLTLRWPAGLKQRVAIAAAINGRSINSEILVQLQAKYGFGLAITHGHLLPCPCGAGVPDATWHGNGRREAHHVQCSCGAGVSDDTEDGAAVRWNGLVRGRLAGRVA